MVRQAITYETFELTRQFLQIYESLYPLRVNSYVIYFLLDLVNSVDS